MYRQAVAGHCFVLFHQPDISCIRVFLSFRSFMKRMSQAAVNDLLTYWSRREDGVQCFSFFLFKDTSPPYVRVAQGSFTPMHWNLFDLMVRNEIIAFDWAVIFYAQKDTGMGGLFVYMWLRCRRWHHIAPIATGVKQMVLNSSMKAALEHHHAPSSSPNRAASILL